MARRISLLSTGGTISTRTGAAASLPRLGAGDLAGQFSHDGSIEVRPRDIAKIPSRAVTPQDMWRLAEAVCEEINDGIDGVVITHGTDTLEETAYALALLVDASVPVVLTGAMRPSNTPGADGPANLAAAIAAAAHAPLARYGPVVVIHDEVHAARWVTKVHSTRLAAFASPAAGPVGMVSEEHVMLLLGPPSRPDRLPTTAPPAARVELIWAVAGADGFVVDAIAGGIDALVVAGTGGGHVPPPLAEALVRLVRTGRPVVLASRCADARVLSQTYRGTGSETHLLSEGLLSAGSLAPLKARLRLLFGLSAGIPAGELFPSVQADT